MNMDRRRTWMLGVALGLASAAGDLQAADYQQDAEGNLAPSMSYGQFIERGMNFVLKEVDGGWAVGNAYTNAAGKPVPAYINYAIADAQHRLGVGHPVNAETVYPAFHHSMFIRVFLAHWRKTKDPECLARARELGDWNLERRTPPDWLYGNMFYSTAVKGKVGGSVDGDAIMTDKPAIMALAMFELADATGNARYRRAAEQVAATLAKTQLPAGNWPFRVNPQTGEVREDYTSSAIYAVMLFEALDGKDGSRWMDAKVKALGWILENPAKTMLWRGFYEDVPSEHTTNRTNWDCIDTARWLVAHRAENPDYLPLALRLNEWIVKEFGDHNAAWAPALGIREQKSCFATMGVHTLHWAALQADLQAATGDAAFKSRALNACALVTYWMRPGNAIVVGPTWKDEIWFSCHLGTVLYMYDTLGRYPDAVHAKTVVVPASSELTDWKPLMRVAPVDRDSQGQLLPLQSYHQTIRRGMSFLLDDHLKWFKGPADSVVDEKGQTQMPWIYYSNLQHNGAPFPGSVDRFVSYPAYHHALLIRTFIGYWRYVGDERALAEAVKLADWNIAHSTPADWPYAMLPWSTFQEKKPGGFVDRNGLMPDKAAIMALGYLQLYEATREARFCKAAEAIANTLAARQRPDGTWPFRVDPKTEAVIEEYTSSVIYAVRLFESLDKLNGNERYRTSRDKTWNWLVNGPIKTKEFRGFYEDIQPSPDGRINYDCLDTIRYLLANRTADNGYLEMATDLNLWIEKTFMDKIKGFEPAEGIREQLQCNVVMGIHSLNWASMLLKLAKATGDKAVRQRATQTANYVTYYLQPDNRIVVGFQYHQWWYSCHAGVLLYLLEFLPPS